MRFGKLTKHKDGLNGRRMYYFSFAIAINIISQNSSDVVKL